MYRAAFSLACVGDLTLAAEKTIMADMGSRKYIKIATFFIALVILGVSFFAGVLYGRENRPGVLKVANVLGKEEPPQFDDVDFNLFWDVWSRLEEKFVDREDINRENLVFGAAAGLVSALDDPYTEFLPPQETQQFQEDIKGEFGGIGAEIGIRRGTLTIISPLRDNPAEKAGLKAGDQVLQVDETITADLTLDEAVRLIRGPKGEEVRLLVLRDTFDTPREFIIVRDTIKIPIMTTEVRDDGIFVIQLGHFTESAAFEFRKAVKEFFESGSEKLILDLRNNPGGFLTIAIDIASWFAPSGETIARERFGDGSEEIYRSSGYQLFEEVPTVLLVNEGSASASEIVAGALRDLNGTQLVGRTTFGKGSVQELVSLPKDSSLKVTIAKWLTPNGEEINGTGLAPDVEVPALTAEEIVEIEEQGGEFTDRILERAVEVLLSQ